MIATEYLLKLVRSAVNEYSTQADSFSEMVDDTLVSFIRMAAPMIVQEVLPVYMVPKSVYLKPEEAAQYYIKRPDGMTVIRIPLPDDFCRFISFCAKGWNQVVDIIHSSLSPLYKSQYSSSPGIGSGCASPAVFLAEHYDGNKAGTYIEAHSIPSPADFSMTYVATPEVSNTEVAMDARLSAALAYKTASLYLQSINDANGSKAAYDMANDIIVKLNSISIL